MARSSGRSSQKGSKSKGTSNGKSSMKSPIKSELPKDDIMHSPEVTKLLETQFEKLCGKLSQNI